MKPPIDPYLQAVGRNVKAAREARNLSLRKLADLSEVDKASLWRFEAGKEGISVLSLRQLARAMDIPVFVLMMEDTDVVPITSVQDILSIQDMTRIVIPKARADKARK